VGFLAHPADLALLARFFPHIASPEFQIGIHQFNGERTPVVPKNSDVPVKVFLELTGSIQVIPDVA